MPGLRPAALALALLAAACGESREEREFDRLGRECEGLVAAGATVRDAQRVLAGFFVAVGPACSASFVPLGGNNVCEPPTAENPQCQIFYYYYPADLGICEPTGCWLVCETRVMRGDPAWGDEPTPIDATICASRWLRGQPGPF